MALAGAAGIFFWGNDYFGKKKQEDPPPQDDPPPQIFGHLVKGFILGAFGGIFGFAIVWLLVYLPLLLFIQLVSKYGMHYTQSQIHQGYSSAWSLCTLGESFGLIMGFMIGVLTNTRKYAGKGWRKNIVIFSSGLLLILTVVVVLYLYKGPISNNVSWAILLVIMFGGFISGSTFDIKRTNWIPFCLLICIAYIVSLLIAKIFEQSLFTVLASVVCLLYSLFVLCSLFGYMYCNEITSPRSLGTKGSWKKFFLWNASAWVCGLTLPWLSQVILGTIVDFTLPGALIGILIGVGNGQGKRLQNTPEIPRVSSQTSKPIFRWSIALARFRNSFFVVFMTISLIIFMISYDVIVVRSQFNRYVLTVVHAIGYDYMLRDFNLNALYLVTIFLSTAIISFATAIVVGILYGFCYVIIDKLANVSRRDVGKTGVIIGAVISIVAGLPSFFKIMQH